MVKAACFVPETDPDTKRKPKAPSMRFVGFRTVRGAEATDGRQARKHFMLMFQIVGLFGALLFLASLVSGRSSSPDR